MSVVMCVRLLEMNEFNYYPQNVKIKQSQKLNLNF